MKATFFKYAIAALAGCAVFTSCSDDDDNTTTVKDPKTVQFIVTSSDRASDLAGGAHMRVFTNLDTTFTQQAVYGSDAAVKSYDSYTQVSYNSTSGNFTGYIYARGASASGIGAMTAGTRTYSVANGTLTELGTFKVANFGNVGTFGEYSYAAQISNPIVARLNKSAAGVIDTLNFASYKVDEVTPAITNILDRGSNEIAIVNYTSNRDSAAVLLADYNFGLKSMIYDSRIGTSYGAWRSVRYSMSDVDDNGDLYVFSGVSATATKVGAVRIKKGASTFDTSYHFDIYTASDGRRFRRAFHISDDKFILDFYPDKDTYGNMTNSGKWAVVDMSEKTLIWVTGLPEATAVTTVSSWGWGDGYNGYFYLPVTPDDASVASSIYKINATTGVASLFFTSTSTDLIKGISIVK